MTRVAIFGCGPSGLLAAHACTLAGADFQIYSRPAFKGGPPAKSVLHGSQYLHTPIPDLMSEAEGEDVTYVNIGTPEEYRRKTHGSAWDGIAAPEEFETNHRAWNIRVAYERLWCRYGLRTRPMEFDGNRCNCRIDGKWLNHVGHVREHIKLDNYDLVVSTVPRTLWRMPGDEFVYSKGWALGDSPGLEPGAKVASFAIARAGVPNNTIICDGTDLNAWNRASKVFGASTIEWPDSEERPHPNAVRFIKPLRCEPTRGIVEANRHGPPWEFAGRYGEWRKGVVTTDVFEQVMKVLQ